MDSTYRTFWHKVVSLITALYLGLLGIALTQSVAAADPADYCGRIQVSGSSYLSGSGVDVHSNFPYQTTGSSCAGETEVHNLNANPAQYGYGWQCVELVNRLYLSRHWISSAMNLTGGAAKNMYSDAASGKFPGIVARSNGGGYKPVPGDVIVHSNGSYGHVAIVTSVTTDRVYSVEQNSSTSGANSYLYDNATGAVSRAGVSITGYVHATANTATTQPGGGSTQYTSFPVVGDWDGNGTTTSGVVYVTPSGLHWQLNNANYAGGATGGDFYYGGSDAKPVVGDWDGNGTTTVGVVYNTPNGLHWQLNNFNTSGGANAGDFYYGGNDSIPITGDWDGNGTTTVGVAYPSAGQYGWDLSNCNCSGSPTAGSFKYGGTSGYPVTGDWNGDRATTVGVAYTTSSGTRWNLTNCNCSGGSDAGDFVYGGSNSLIPVTGNWDGANGASVGIVYREPSQLHWTLTNYRSSAGADAGDFYYGGSN